MKERQPYKAFLEHDLKTRYGARDQVSEVSASKVCSGST